MYAKALLYRPSSLTNVYVQTGYGMYNYAVLGVKSLTVSERVRSERRKG